MITIACGIILAIAIIYIVAWVGGLVFAGLQKLTRGRGA